MELLSRVHARNLVEWARDKPDIVVLSADLTSSKVEKLLDATFGITEADLTTIRLTAVHSEAKAEAL